MKNVLETLQLQAPAQYPFIGKLQLEKESYTELTNGELSDIHGGTSPVCVSVSLLIITILSVAN